MEVAGEAVDHRVSKAINEGGTGLDEGLVGEVAVDDEDG